MFKNPFLPYSVAMVTPFDQGGAIDETGIKELINYYRGNGVPALLISGSTGEQHSMTIPEKVKLYHEVKHEVQSDLLVYGGVASFLTKDAVILAHEAEKANLDAMMVGFPPYLRITQSEAYQYVSAICSSSKLPIMLYNNPLRTGFNLEHSTLIRMANDFPQIVALKEAGNPDRVMQVKAALGHDFLVLSGSDATILDDIKKGYDGITSVAGNIYPHEIKHIMQLIQANNHEQASAEVSKLKVSIEMIIQLGAIKTIKHILMNNGIAAGYCREPLSQLTITEHDLVKSIKLPAF
ncbi:MAG: dihydrodipicolinate synthase family protein [Gorillibacterium sp.]|nr:dihydrodipicolinate synthase family protein [Gorillibacterium sp.]